MRTRKGEERRAKKETTGEKVMSYEREETNKREEGKEKR